MLELKQLAEKLRSACHAGGSEFPDVSGSIPLKALNIHGEKTSRGIPWKLVYSEEYSDKTSAIKREREIKRKKSRRYIEELVCHAGGRPA